jgi:hypothetical protein
MKNIIVKGHDWVELITVDNDLFDDYVIEACTQALEKRIRDGMTKITPVIQVWEDVKNKKTKIHVYNTYKLLINAGFHTKAELLRSFFLHETKIDLAKEPIKARA